MNHSCDPNTLDKPKGGTHDAYAVRKIARGEELTCDYALTFYDEPDYDHDQCGCGSANCRGEIVGFKSLSDEEKERLLPFASPAVRAMYLADTGQGPPVKVGSNVDAEVLPSNGVIRIDPPVFPERTITPTLRLVCPPPSSCSTNVAVKACGEGEFRLFTCKDFGSGDKVYHVWSQPWPATPKDFELVFGTPHNNSVDPPEGTVISMRTSANEQQNPGGRLRFTAWEMLTSHSSKPNVVYDDCEDDADADGDGYWKIVYATRNIKAGEELTVDYNSLLWDRPSQVCKKSAEKSKCGLTFLPQEAPEEPTLVPKHHVVPRYNREDVVTPTPGEARDTTSMHDVEKEAREECPEVESTSSESSSLDEGIEAIFSAMPACWCYEF